MTSDTPHSAHSPAAAKQAPTKVARLRLDRSGTSNASSAGIDHARNWASIKPMRADAASMKRNHLFADSQDDDITRRFDMLRTLLATALEENGILRLGVTAPTEGSGTSFIAANLALAMARRPSSRVILADMNLRKPGLARMFGANPPGPLTEFLAGKHPSSDQLRSYQGSLAVLMNSQVAQGSAEILQESSTTVALGNMRRKFGPTVEIYDLPPLLGHDDTLSFLPQLDGVLLVADGTMHTASQLRAAEEMLNGRSKLVAVVLNRGEIRRSLAEIMQDFGDRWFRGRRKR
ncbi:CpsD/CapB family tyrosine-protein kinase [Paracoccus sp. Z330]|uniref:CpsD/CapB family tyrosine-protein kinase n=1 Tax=Paracoccus onchidii TaxID=3017813 RepID=A0ABT4ZBZ5_9RHOB|nr:CpsD/CapB family tyrosine-protein kinase [Paracoccus onchidii]MDB6176889.1 CpsD/CapB family tyrosine-protein kinase [Paracoccus onchidii]